MRRGQSLKESRVGLTLAELLVTIGIFVIIATLGTLISFNFYKQRAIFAERDNLVSVLRRARSEALNNFRESDHGVFVASSSSQYVIFSGTSYASRTALYDETYSMAAKFTFGGLQEVDFQALHAQSSSGTISISNGTQNLIVSVDSEGRIDW